MIYLNLLPLFERWPPNIGFVMLGSLFNVSLIFSYLKKWEINYTYLIGLF